MIYVLKYEFSTPVKTLQISDPEVTSYVLVRESVKKKRFLNVYFLAPMSRFFAIFSEIAHIFFKNVL